MSKKKSLKLLLNVVIREISRDLLVLEVLIYVEHLGQQKSSHGSHLELG